MKFNKTLHRWQETVFHFVFLLMNVLYFAQLFGFGKTATMYLTMLDNIIKIYVSLFLIIRFNPWRRIHFTPFDREVVFTSALYVIATTTINTVIQTFYKKAVDTVANTDVYVDSITAYNQ